MAKTTLNLFYSLVPNTLPETNGYHAAVSHVGTVDAETFYLRVAKERAGLQASTVELVVASVCTTVAEILQERQYRVALGDVSFELAIPGSTDSVDGVMTGPAYVAVRLSAAMRNAAADITPAYSAGDGVKTEVFSVEELATCSLGQIVGTGAFRLAGSNISASGTDESVAVTAVDGSQTVAVVESEDGAGRFITAHLPSALPAGKGTVTLKTHGKCTPEGELRTLSKSVTIVAGEEPGPAAEPPRITGAHSEGESDGEVNCGGAPLYVEGDNLETVTQVELLDESGEVFHTVSATYADDLLTTEDIEDVSRVPQHGSIRVTTAGGSDTYDVAYGNH